MKTECPPFLKQDVSPFPALKAKNEAPPRSKPEAKAKVLKVQKLVLKGVHSHITHILVAQDPAVLEAAQIPRKEHPGEASLTSNSPSH